MSSDPGNGHRVIVTGASRGLGRVLATELARAGWQVGAIARDGEALKTLAGEHSEICVAAADLTQAEEARVAVDALATSMGGLDAIVNNAGKVHFEAFDEMTSPGFEAVIRQNLLTAVHSTQAALPWLQRQESASIVQISSISGIQPLPGGSAYAAAKHALVGWTRSIFSELRHQGIRVSLIHPGSISTERAQIPPEKASVRDPMDPAQVAAALLQVLEAPPGTVLSEVEIRPLLPPAK
jgi:3-oxoacyl-[acyl-carrier protein] reductase